MRPLLLDSVVNDEGIAPDALEPIAIVGLANRFPQQASTAEGLWELLLESRSTWSPIPKERFDSDAFYHPDPEHGGTVCCNHCMLTVLSATDPLYLVSCPRRSLSL